MDALIDVLVAHMLPYLNRQDWNSFCMTSKDISNTVKQSPLLMPPWPANCTLAKGSGPHWAFIHNPHWSPKGTQIVFLSGNKGYIFDCKEGLLKHELSNDTFLYSLAFSPDGKFLVTVSREDGFVRMWNAKDGYKLVKQWQISLGYRYTGVLVAVSPCSKKIAVLWNKKVLLLGIEEDAPLQSLQLDDFGGVGDNVLFSRDGSCLIFTGTDIQSKSGVIKVWKLQANEVFTIPEAYVFSPYAVSSIDISPDGSKLITVSTNEVNAKIWSLDISRADSSMVKLSHVLPTDQKAVSAAFAPNGKCIMIELRTKIIISNVEGSQRREIRSMNGSVSAIRFSPNGKQVVTKEGNSILVKSVPS